MSSAIERKIVRSFSVIESGSVAVKSLIPGRILGLSMGGIVVRPEVPGPVETITINWSVRDLDGNAYALYDGQGNRLQSVVDDNQAIAVPAFAFLFPDVRAVLEDTTPENYVIHGVGKG